MKKFTNILEQRIYIFYFLLTFLLVLIIISIEWQLIKYGITLTENQKINNIFDNYKNKTSEFFNEKLTNLSYIAELLQLKNGLFKENIFSVLDFVGDNDNKNLYIFDEKGNIIYGEYWDVIKKYINLIKSRTEKGQNGYLIVVYGNKPYMLVFKTLMENDTHYKGFILQISNFNPNIPPISDYQYLLLPYPFTRTMLPKSSAIYYDKINNIITNLFLKGKQIRKIVRFSYSFGLGIYANKDGMGGISSILLIPYKRNINIFAQQSIWFFILILIAITMIMIAIFGNWFKKTILHPVKIVSETMKKNSESPINLQKINLDYGGVLGEMIDSFNQMEEALEEHSRYLLEYKIATENIENGVFWLSEDYVILMHNQSFAEILEEKEKLTGKSFLSYIKLSEEDLKKIKAGSLSLKNYELKKDNLIKHLNINFKLVKEKDKNIIVGGVTDITQITKEKIAREKLELELIKTNKLAEIGRRVEGIVHNLNSPLNSIIGYAQLMKKDIGDNEDLEKILKSGKLIAHYIKTLQQKIKNDNVSMYRPIDINKLLKDELELFKNNLFFKHHVKTITKFQKNLPKLNAVYGDVSMCITNIINNALEAMEKSSEKILKITTEVTENNYLKIEISDTGCGISEEDLPNIFEPYYSTKLYPKGSGYGLGLAISKYIVEKYKGKISVKSKLDEGSVFIICFPLEDK